VKTVDIGGGVCLRLLTIRDMIDLTEQAWHAERRSVLEDLDTSQAMPEQRLAALREHSTRRGTAIVLLLATMRLEFAAEIIRRAGKNAGTDVEVALGSMTPAEIIRTAQRLVGYEMSEEPQPGNGNGPASSTT
jgi:hypothetical protein